MTKTLYIGAKCVPSFYIGSGGSSEWVSGVPLEPLTVVTYNGSWYISKKSVPADAAAPQAGEYWAQVPGYITELDADLIEWIQEHIGDLEDDVEELQGDVTELRDDLNDIGFYPEETIYSIITSHSAILPDGTITSGAGETYGVTNKIDVSAFDHFIITTTMGWGNLLYAFYQSDDTFISGEASPSSGYVTITNKNVPIPVNASYIRVSKTNNPYEIKGAHPYELIVQDDVEKLISAVPTKVKCNDLEFSTIDHKWINASGEFIDTTADTYYITGFVDVSEYAEIYITASANWSNRLYAFYDANEDVVLVGTASENTSTFTTVKNGKVTVPSGAKYIVVAGRASSLMPNVAIFYRYVPIGKWYGKKWVCVGDSLTEQNAATSIHYYDYVSETTDITPIIMGVSGSGYARKADQSQAFYQRISSCPTDADVVTIFGSFNDLGTGLPIGSVDDNGTTTIAGCINKTIDNLQTVIPLVNLGIVAPAPWNTTQPSTSGSAYDYVEMLKAICARRSIPFLDLWRCSNLRPWDADFRAIAYSHDGGNGTHPDENGHKLIASRFKAFLETLLIDL